MACIVTQPLAAERGMLKSCEAFITQIISCQAFITHVPSMTQLHKCGICYEAWLVSPGNFGLLAFNM